MSDLILYVDTSDVREGALEELKAGIRELVDFVEANEPRIIAYNVYFNDEGTKMTVVHAHADSASFEYHMEVAGPLFRQLARARHAVRDPHLRRAKRESGETVA